MRSSDNGKNKNAAEVIAELTRQASPEKAAAMRRFFKTGKGQYAERDEFLGLSTPDIRNTMKGFSGLPLPEIRTMLFSKFHEVRSCALAVMAGQYAKGDAGTGRNSSRFIRPPRRRKSTTGIWLTPARRESSANTKENTIPA